MEGHHQAFRTERLLLRPFSQDDRENLVELDSDPEVIRHTGTWFANGCRATRLEEVDSHVLPRILMLAEKFGPLSFWAAERLDSGEFIGWFHFFPGKGADCVELGFRLKRSAWGQGYATEGAEALIVRGRRDWGVRKVTASSLEANPASIRVLEKLGMDVAFNFQHFPGGKALSFELTL